jgi:hypothetical protein
MKLNVVINENSYQIEVADEMLFNADTIYSKMDKDMDAGWQMSREWVDELSTRQRCQVVADRLLTAIESGNEPSTMLMAGYIMTHMPGITTVQIATDGDMSQTDFH